MVVFAVCYCFYKLFGVIKFKISHKNSHTSHGFATQRSIINRVTETIQNTFEKMKKKKKKKKKKGRINNEIFLKKKIEKRRKKKKKRM